MYNLFLILTCFCSTPGNQCCCGQPTANCLYFSDIQCRRQLHDSFHCHDCSVYLLQWTLFLDLYCSCPHFCNNGTHICLNVQLYDVNMFVFMKSYSVVSQAVYHSMGMCLSMTCCRLTGLWCFG